MNEVHLSAGYPVPELQRITDKQGTIGWREAGKGPCIVLLHGISSGSTAWAKQFNDSELTGQFRLLAWDAPGYGKSDALPMDAPQAKDYAQALRRWLNALNVQPALLVGHSLGALMAGAYAAEFGDIPGMVLANPAQGYGSADEAKRQQIYSMREEQMTQSGVAGYARQRAAKLLRPNALDADLAQVRYGMSRLHERGFCQAAYMLANDDIHRYLSKNTAMTQVWCGDLDTITPPEAAQTLARRYQAEFVLLPNAGHASYLDAAQEFNFGLRRMYSLSCKSNEFTGESQSGKEVTENELSD